MLTQYTKKRMKKIEKKRINDDEQLKNKKN